MAGLIIGLSWKIWLDTKDLCLTLSQSYWVYLYFFGWYLGPFFDNNKEVMVCNNHYPFVVDSVYLLKNFTKVPKVRTRASTNRTTNSCVLAKYSTTSRIGGSMSTSILLMHALRRSNYNTLYIDHSSLTTQQNCVIFPKRCRLPGPAMKGLEVCKLNVHTDRTQYSNEAHKRALICLMTS